MKITTENIGVAFKESVYIEFLIQAYTVISLCHYNIKLPKSIK